MFISLRLKGDRNARWIEASPHLKTPGTRSDCTGGSIRSLGAEFFRWDSATAVAGHVLGIHPFDQPNVQESNDNTARVFKEVETLGRPALPTPPRCRLLAQLLTQAAPTGTLLRFRLYDAKPQT